MGAEKPRGTVEEGAAAASGPGMETTDQSADGVGLATPASSLTASQAVDNTTADPANHNATSAGPTEPVDESPEPPVTSEPPPHEPDTTSRDRTPPSEDASGGEVQEVAASHDGATGDKVEGGEMDDKDGRVETSEDETTTATPHAPQSMSLEGEWTGQASGGISKPTALETDPTRPSRDPEDATGDDERRPDAPTEPPNMPEGTKGRGSRDGDARVETEVSRTSRGHAEGTGDSSIKARRPEKPDQLPDEVEGARVQEVEMVMSKVSRSVEEDPGDDGGEGSERPDEPPDEPRGESGGPTDVQVEPGGETKAERIECAAHEDAGAEVDGEAAETRRDAEVEVESAGTRRGTSVEGERDRAREYARSMTTDEENDQRNEANIVDVPGTSPEPPPPLTSPDEPARRQNKPPSVELEGEKGSRASCDDRPTRADADVSGVSVGDEDTRNVPRKLQRASEHVREHLEQGSRKDSPEGARAELDDPGDKADASSAPGRVEDVGNRPTKLKNTSEREQKCSRPMDEEDSPRRTQDEPDALGDKADASRPIESSR